MGRSKALLPWGDRTLAEAWADRFAACGVMPVALVLGGDAPAPEGAGARPGLRVVRNEDPDGTGPRESLLLGLDALPADRPAFFTPVDVPVPAEETLRRLLAAWRDAEGEPFAVVPVFEGRRGHPVLVGPDFVRRLFEGEPGDRIDAMFAWATRRVLLVEVDDPRVVANMNRPEDYLRWAPASG